MEIFNRRIQEVSSYYHHGDLDLGYRRLIDSALDTGKTDILIEVISFTNWKYANQRDAHDEAQRAIELLEKIKKAGCPSPNQNQSKILEGTDLKKTYKKGNFSLGPLNISLQKSEVAGLVGENGNGKTTLLRLLCGELKPSEGSINYYFKEKTKNAYDLRTKLVYIPQRIEVLRGGLMDNLQFTLTTHGVKGEENFYLAQTMLARMGLWPYKDLNWSRLSSGYKMRFELARTLLRKPEVLLLDEPLANLDILAQQIILEDLKYLSSSLLRPFGVVLSSQQLYEVEKVSDKIIFLEKGQLINDSSVKGDDKPLANLILELDSSATREDLQQKLHAYGLEKIHFNGGNYILFFSENKTIQDAMLAMGQEQIPVTYLRNISESSRRFFIN